MRLKMGLRVEKYNMQITKISKRETMEETEFTKQENIRILG